MGKYSLPILFNITRRLITVHGNSNVRTFYFQPYKFCKETVPKRVYNAEDIKLYKKTIEDIERRKRSIAYYTIAATCFMGGLAFLSVPLFDAFCRVTSYAGTINVDLTNEKSRNMKRVEDRELLVNFIADKNSYLQWKFQPLQYEIKVVPGETVLAFYSAENNTDKPISGISTYSVVPYEAAKYFNKIQCFCFDEQRLNPREQVDMPVFFYIDPDYATDPYLVGVDCLTLSYTFFEAVDGLDLPFMSSFREDYDENV